ncbi:SDR family oxidoreductase [Caballeronia sp. LZ065]|uniref:SDR family oxidoreductase n=1 Tax=Caballeronia sp. LZ065 TaxID=3038571 RepID=UPI0028555150|nr:SDR family oxidoreductase [Caballeronia sp. LZ065]MDR5781132.1 SDR family oxidoreductase [Caballeronia sp. LZ065]
MTRTKRHALVAGGMGVIGRTLVEHLSSQPGWTVTAISRRPPDFESAASFVSVDLLDEAATKQGLADLDDVDHIFHAAYQAHEDVRRRGDTNLAMLANLVNAVDECSPALQRVCLYEGGKYYGSHLGAFSTPARESDPRHMPPMFYYDQEDWLRERARDRPWDHIVLRPDTVCGLALDNPMNLAMVIAVYAAISKELGLPLRFPGTVDCYNRLAQVTDATQLARASEWAAENATGSEAYNITNGDLFRWRPMWEKFARFFDMPLADPMPISLVSMMADKGDVWNRVVARYGLSATPYERAASWAFGDYIFHRDYDVIFSTTKIRQAGFHSVVDSESMFLALFNELRSRRMLP